MVMPLAVSSNKTKKFVYLLQGSKNNVTKYKYLQNSDADLITLTYDLAIPPSDGFGLKNEFFSNSTWAQGRNQLLEIAIGVGKNWEYYIFIDDDVVFEKGNHLTFQNALIHYQPLIAMPLCDEIRRSKRYNKLLEIQIPEAFDQLCQAYHRDVVSASTILPFDDKFDSDSWWYSCEINQFEIFFHHPKQVFQFNNIQIRNGNHCWDDDSRTTDIPGSIYLGGISQEGLERVRDYLSTKYVIPDKNKYQIFDESRFKPISSWTQFRRNVKKKVYKMIR